MLILYQFSAEGTLLFYLASTQSKDDRNVANLLGHRVMSNISTLCYHHLSPYTSMQPNTRKKRVGGTDASSRRRRRAMSSTLQSPSIDISALSSFESGSEAPTLVAPMEVQVLPSLVVTPKRIRGPIYVSAAKGSRPIRWDGQSPVKNIQTSSAFTSHLQAMIEATSEEITQAKERFGPDDTRVEQLKIRIRKEKAELKSALTKKKKDDDRQALQSEVAGLLHKVVEKAQTNNDAWLGARRFNQWATGSWLPP